MSATSAITCDTPELAAGTKTRGHLHLVRWSVILIALALGWRLIRYALGFPMWGDEAMVAVCIQTRDYRGMLEPLENIQIVPLLFMWAERTVADLLGDGERALRLVPVLAGSLAIVAFAFIGRRLLDRRSAFLALALLAASYYPARHATEVKPYSVDLLASVLIMLSACAVWRSPRRLLGWVLLTFVSSVAVWCSYPSVFVSGGALAVLGLVFLRARSWPALLACSGSGLVLTASFLGMYLTVGQTQASEGAGLFGAGSIWLVAFPPVSEPWKLPWWFLQTHTGPLLAYPLGGKDWGSTATFIFVAVGVGSLWRKNRTVLLLLLAPFVMTMFAAALKKYPYGDSARIAQHLAPMICLLAGAGLMALARRIGGRTGVEGTVVWTRRVMVIIILAGLSADVIKPHKEIDDRRLRDAVRWLDRASGEADHWVVAGSFEGPVRAADMRRWGGRVARLRYYALYARGDSVAWSPAIEDLPTTGVVWLIVYHQGGPSARKLNGAAASYAQRVEEALGTPETIRFPIDPETLDVWIEVRRFELCS